MIPRGMISTVGLLVVVFSAIVAGQSRVLFVDVATTGSISTALTQVQSASSTLYDSAVIRLASGRHSACSLSISTTLGSLDNITITALNPSNPPSLACNSTVSWMFRVLSDAPPITFSNLNFLRASANFRGTALRTFAGNLMSVVNCSFTSFSSTDIFQPIFASGAANLVIQGSRFTSNTAYAGGAALFFSSTVQITNCIFTQNTASLNGGAIYSESSLVVIRNSFFALNSGIKGGHIYAITSPNLKIFDSELSSATSGGAVYCEQNCLIQSERNTFKSNEGNSGGSIFAGSSSKITDNNSKFSDNRASTGDGGAIYCGSGSLVNLSSTTIENSVSASSGAGVYISSGTILISNGNFTGNSASLSGGAIFAESLGRITLQDSTFSSNRALSHGGAVFSGLSSSLNASNCQFESNSADSGAGVYLEQYSSANFNTCDFVRNSASQYAGGIFLYGGSSTYLDVINCQFFRNSAEFYGGGLATGIDLVSLKISDSFFFRNTAENGAAVWAHLGVFNVINCFFRRNYALSFGHSLCFGCGDEESSSASAQTVAMVLENTFFDSASFGGAVEQRRGSLYIESSLFQSMLSRASPLRLDNTEAIVKSCEFNALYAFTGGAIGVSNLQNKNVQILQSIFNGSLALFSGGALYIQDSESVEIRDCIFDSNEATLNGGAIFGERSTFTVTDSLFLNNVGSDRGGVMDLTECDASIVNSNFDYNGGPRLGGCIFHNGGELIVMESEFVGCQSSTSGGAVHIGSGASNFDLFDTTVKLLDSSFSVGSSIEGAGISITGSDVKDVEITRCLFSENVASSQGGDIIVTSSSAETKITESQFSLGQSPNGGSIFFNTGSKFSILSSSFSDATAEMLGGALYLTSSTFGTIESCVFSGNSAIQESGGAIYAYDAKQFEISKSTFSMNKASRNGGAICTIEQTELISSENKFSSNEAAIGGALSISGSLKFSGDHVFSNNSVKLAAGCLGGTGIGGAIALFIDECESEETTYALEFLKNSAELSGGGIWFKKVGGCSEDLLIHSSFQSNSAGYGNDKATGFRKIGLVETTSIDVDITVTSNSTVTHPGQQVGLTVALLDAFNNQLQGSHEDVTITVEIENTDTLFASSVSSEIKAVNGEATFPIDLFSSTLDFNQESFDIKVKSDPSGENDILLSIMVSDCEYYYKLVPASSNSSSFKCALDANLDFNSQVTIWTFSSFLAIWILFFSIAFVVLQDHASVKRSGSSILQVILFGGVLIVIGLLLMPLNESSVRCHMEDVLLEFGFIFIFGIITLKTFRLHKIFNNRNLRVMAITNIKLCLMLLPALIIASIIFIVWGVVYPYEVNDRFQPACESSATTSMAIALLFLNYIILVFGAYFTFCVRKIPPAFNESRENSMAIYNAFVVLGVEALFIFGDFEFSEWFRRTTRFAFWFYLLLSTYAIIFWPVFYYYFKDRKQRSSTLGSHMSITTESSAGKDDESRRRVMTRLMNFKQLDDSISPEDAKVINHAKELWGRIEKLTGDLHSLQNDVIQISWKLAIIEKLKQIDHPMVKNLSNQK